MSLAQKIWPGERHIKHSCSNTAPLAEMLVTPLLTPEVLRQAQQQPHRLVVLVSGTTGGTQHQSFSPWSSGGPKDAVNVCPLNHLKRDGDRKLNSAKLGI